MYNVITFTCDQQERVQKTPLGRAPKLLHNAITNSVTGANLVLALKVEGLEPPQPCPHTDGHFRTSPACTCGAHFPSPSFHCDRKDYPYRLHFTIAVLLKSLVRDLMRQANPRAWEARTPVLPQVKTKPSQSLELPGAWSLAAGTLKAAASPRRSKQFQAGTGLRGLMTYAACSGACNVAWMV